MISTDPTPGAASAGAAPGAATATSDSPAPDDRRKPSRPGEIPSKSWKYVAKRAIYKFSADGSTDMAASLTYYSVLSLFPATLALLSILGIVGQAEKTTTLLLDMVTNMADEKVASTLAEPLKQLTESRGAGWALAFGIVAALWSASAYVGAFSRSMNRIYGIDEGRPVWKLRPALLLVTLGAVLMVAAMALMLVLSGPVARAVGDVVGIGETALTVWNIGKWPVVGILAILLIAVLYYFTPNVRQPKFRWISVGAAFALVSILLASTGFGFYVANFSKYEKTYGTVAGMIVLLLWLWLMNLMLLMGAQVDAELERVRQLQAGIEAEARVQLPPRDSVGSTKKYGKQQVLIAEARNLRKSLEPDNDRLKDSSEVRTLKWTAGVGAVVAVAAVMVGNRRRMKIRKD